MRIPRLDLRAWRARVRGARSWPWSRIVEVVTAIAACAALVISIVTAGASNSRVDRTREDDLRERLRDDMSKLGELDIDMRGDASDRQAAALQLGVHSLEAWEIINQIGPAKVSAIDLALTAQALSQTGLYVDADRAITLALQRPTVMDVRIVLLNSAMSVFYQTGDLVQVRKVAAELVGVYDRRTGERRARGNSYANLGDPDVARTRFVWAYIEGIYRNCAEAREQYEQGKRLMEALTPPALGVPEHEKRADQVIREYCRIK